jgi:signal recognition particle GTPase
MRIASVEMKDANPLLKQFTQMQEMMKSFKGEQEKNSKRWPHNLECSPNDEKKFDDVHEMEF